MPARERRVHQGVGFDLWTGQRSWFWKLADRGAIGAALSHPQAISEACMAIDELLESDASFSSVAVCDISNDGWRRALDRLAHYVTTA